MIKTSTITNLGNSIPKALFEMTIKSFIANHETYEGERMDKSKINIVSVYPISNGESTFYEVMWEYNMVPMF